MYVTLTSKPGQFRTEPTPGLAPVRAGPLVVNCVPVKILRHFGTVEARRKIRTLATFGRIDARLEPAAP
ncbi:hypothetical protein [Belnapia rosea]|jgi:hypothetical protein|uniref:Uncharacterized protein n=1 Tax=Belnapia rosea TaxID=938405 RepID=A0A1G6USR7_9PROT|nr:hypothetical protein [Belnapia rosea]SDD44349.1 hypothetical protein SAMN04487779_100812 [Belnapia rosea]